MLKKIIKISPFILLAFAITLPLTASLAGEEFDPGMLISDEAFGNAAAFTSADTIQRFLDLRGSVLANTSVEFLRMLKEPVDINLKNQLEDPNANLGRLRTAAELIYDAAQQGKINPQVILVTLQKEQSLIDGVFTNSNTLQRRLDRAMGFACPDSGTCGDLFLGFYFQLFGNVDHEGNRYLGATKSLARSFYTEAGGVLIGRGPAVDASGRTFGSGAKVRVSRVGDTITVDNTQGPPYNASATQTFTLKNSATAALYRYTPHVYNGNYNFWKFFRQWFKFSNGSLVKLSGSEAVYFVENGELRPVSGAVLGLRKLDVTTAITVSKSEFDQYKVAKPLPPPAGTLISPASGGARYVVEDNLLRPISDFVAGQRKLNLAATMYLPVEEVASYEVGPAAPPLDGTLVKSAGQPVVYLVQSGTIRPISGFVFKQRGYDFSKVVVAPDVEINSWNKGTTLPPLDGTLVKSAGQPLIYYVGLNQKFPVPYFVFQLRKFKFNSVVTLGDDEIENLTLGDHLAPLDGTLLKAKGNPTVYLVEAGETHYISGYLFTSRGYKFGSVIEITPSELALLPSGEPLYLRDGTLFKLAGDPTVYVIEAGGKHPISGDAFKSRGYKFSDVIEIPAAEADRYPTGAAIK